MKRTVALILSAIIAVSFTGGDAFAFAYSKNAETTMATTKNSGTETTDKAGARNADGKTIGAWNANGSGTETTYIDTGATGTTSTDNRGTGVTDATEATDADGLNTKTKATEANKDTTKTPTAKTKQKPPKLPKLAKPKKLKAYSGYRSVKLTWEAVPKAEEYIILRKVAGKGKFKKVGKTDKLTYVDKLNYIYDTYAYRVVATRHYTPPQSEKTYLIKSAPAKIREGSVMRLRVYITFKKTKNIDGCEIKEGTTVRSDGFSRGRYYFTYKGKRLCVPNILVDVEDWKYEKDDNYSKTEAAYFMNDITHRKKITTEKKYIIWVSTDTQHLYVFKRKKGKWKVVKDWEVSTGRAYSPTPTGLKTVRKKVLSRHGVQFWNCFSSWNAIHGICWGMEASIGRIASSGCVRNNTGNAAWIYTKCGKGTRVLIY